MQRSNTSEMKSSSGIQSHPCHYVVQVFISGELTQMLSGGWCVPSIARAFLVLCCVQAAAAAGEIQNGSAWAELLCCAFLFNSLCVNFIYAVNSPSQEPCQQQQQRQIVWARTILSD